MTSAADYAPFVRRRAISGPFLLALAVLPEVFFWFLLRDGYTRRQRILGACWLVFMFLARQVELFSALGRWLDQALA